MAEYTAKTLFEGKIPIPEKKVLTAYRKCEPLYACYQGKLMTIPYLKLKSGIIYKGKWEKDLWGRIDKEGNPKKYRLYYYLWQPDVKTKESEYKKYFV